MRQARIGTQVGSANARDRVSQPKVIKHGTHGGYTHGACRCDLCRKALVDYMRKYRATRKVVDEAVSEIERLRDAGDALATRLRWWTDDTDASYPDHEALRTWEETRRD